jgi:hypothetical protein
MNLPQNWSLPKGYKFVIVPRDALVDAPGPMAFNHKIKYKWNWFKILISIIQLLYSLYSLYQVTEHELERFGYAAYGLTVAPYALMGLLNLVANLITPEFDGLSLVSSTALKEVLHYSGISAKDLVIVGTLAEAEASYRNAPYRNSQYYEIDNNSDTAYMLGSRQIVYLKASHPVLQRLYKLLSITSSTPNTQQLSHTSLKRNTFLTILSASAAVGVGAIVYTLSRLQPGQSSLGERIWIVGWLVCGSISPFVMIFLSSILAFIGSLFKLLKGQAIPALISVMFLVIFVFLTCSAAAFTIGGVIAVGQMMWAFGTCRVLS